MTALLALAANAGCALLLYLASPQQRLRAMPLPASARLSATVLGAVSLALWITAAGIGAGIAAALITFMLSCVSLPYLAWRFGPAVAKEGRR
ncbi:hypothetical protein [Dyella koreensis]|uniref:Uncharacterized protein n=1 Tax=Dyella koreensis TaxID=311235 RepID=A0ABW8K771_9GAMM